MFPILETDRLKLVELGYQHVQSLFEILSIEEVMRYYGSDSFTTPNEAMKLIEIFQKNYKEKRGIRWGIVLKENKKLIGSLGLNSLLLKNKRAEIGYEIHPNYWRNGYTTEAIKKVLRFSFHELALNRIGAVVYPENEPSLRLLKKLSFTEEGLLRDYMYQSNQYHDTIVLSLLKPEWEKSQEN
jgi:[ribosomal protein S5]-alanine N-acetyltransferase